MEWVWITLGVLLTISGIVGCILPFIPGPPLNYAALLVLLLTDRNIFDSTFLLIWLIITIAVTLLDYYVPVWGTKKFGGSSKGVWGATLGLLTGIFFFPPFGIIAGPFIGAVLGELLSGKQLNVALKSGLGSFIGFIAGTVMKLTVSIMLAFYFFKAII